MDDQRDYAEEAYNRQMMEEEGKAEALAELVENLTALAIDHKGERMLGMLPDGTEPLEMHILFHNTLYSADFAVAAFRRYGIFFQIRDDYVKSGNLYDPVVIVAKVDMPEKLEYFGLIHPNWGQS